MTSVSDEKNLENNPEDQEVVDSSQEATTQDPNFKWYIARTVTGQ